MTSPQQYAEQLKEGPDGLSIERDDTSIPLFEDMYAHPSGALGGNRQFYNLDEGELLYTRDAHNKDDEDYDRAWSFLYDEAVIVVYGDFVDGQLTNIRLSDVYDRDGHSYKDWFLNAFEGSLNPEDVTTTDDHTIHSVREKRYTCKAQNGTHYLAPAFARFYNEKQRNKRFSNVGLFALLIAMLFKLFGQEDPYRLEKE